MPLNQYLSLNKFFRYFLKSFLSFLGLFLILLYGISWGDDQMQMIYQEIGFKSFSSSLQLIWESLKYFFGGVLFYGWWSLIVIGSLILSVVTSIAIYGIKKYSTNSNNNVA